MSLYLFKKTLTLPLIGALILSLAGCVTLSRTDFPILPEDQNEAVHGSINIVRITPQNIATYATDKRNIRAYTVLPTKENWKYYVGAGDVLSIIVWDHPELTLPSGPERSQVESGSSVNANGDIFYPYINLVQVAGRSVDEIQTELTERLAKYIPDPQIEVKVAAFNSQNVVVTGAVVRPGSLSISNIPLTLVEAVNGSGGLDAGADIKAVTVQRNGRTYFVNLNAFMTNGSAIGNPVLKDGDIVNVPLFENNVAYVMGEIQQPGAVDLGPGGINLTEAITTRGGLVKESANAQGIFVFRSKDQNTGFDVFQLDATTPLAFVLATQFALHPQDVVYIVTDPAAQWNAVIASLLPSISAISSIPVVGGGLL